VSGIFTTLGVALAPACRHDPRAPLAQRRMLMGDDAAQVFRTGSRSLPGNHRPIRPRIVHRPAIDARSTHRRYDGRLAP
jgi:hypothetical protein